MTERPSMPPHPAPLAQEDVPPVLSESGFAGVSVMHKVPQDTEPYDESTTNTGNFNLYVDGDPIESATPEGGVYQYEDQIIFEPPAFPPLNSWANVDHRVPQEDPSVHAATGLQLGSPHAAPLAPSDLHRPGHDSSGAPEQIAEQFSDSLFTAADEDQAENVRDESSVTSATQAADVGLGVTQLTEVTQDAPTIPTKTEEDALIEASVANPTQSSAQGQEEATENPQNRDDDFETTETSSELNTTFLVDEFLLQKEEEFKLKEEKEKQAMLAEQQAHLALELAMADLFSDFTKDEKTNQSESDTDGTGGDLSKSDVDSEKVKGSRGKHEAARMSVTTDRRGVPLDWDGACFGSNTLLGIKEDRSDETQLPVEELYKRPPQILSATEARVLATSQSLAAIESGYPITIVSTSRTTTRRRSRGPPRTEVAGRGPPAPGALQDHIRSPRICRTVWRWREGIPGLPLSCGSDCQA
ncbi:hypothetical protein C7M84_013469 [Penaeus vannamei]|uniref:Uncharacterized protein n=1 Tax=Penaeus vannamei TaxID=6689 RepID=A0A423SVY5_PENVA|nr:hypothetical protein C7M84_013469 [Penaeus vannamei]